MTQVKLFVDIESNIEAMEEKINTWLRTAEVNVIKIFGNVAPQTVTTDAKGAKLAERKFSSSDVFVAVVYESR